MKHAKAGIEKKIGNLLDRIMEAESRTVIARYESEVADSDDAAHPFRSDRAHRSDLMPPGWGADRGPIFTCDNSVGQAAWVTAFRRMDSPDSSSR